MHIEIELVLIISGNFLLWAAMLVCCFKCCRGKQSRPRVVPDLDNVEDGIAMETQPMTTNAAPPPVAVAKDGGALGSNTSIQGVAVPSTLIHAAAVNGEKPALQKLIAGRPSDINKGDQFGRSPLMFAVLADRLDCAELLIKNGARVNFEDNGGRTALHWAAYKGNFRMCKLLLSKGANWKKKDHEGQKALHLATKHQKTKCMALIMKHLEPGEVDEQDNAKRTALHWSASYGNEEAVVMLMRHNSNIGIPDTDGKTPLHWAASSGDTPAAVKTVQIILDKEPSVINWQDYEGRTALHLAVAHGHSTVVKQLINFQTPLEKCNISVLDNAFRTPLHWAAVLGHTHIVNLLLDHNANFTSSDSNGATPLHYAAQNNHAETVESFLARENITDEPDMEGRTALMWAAGKGAENVIRSIVKHNPDINATDKTGATALHAASMSGHTSCVTVLMELGANVNILDASKHTPLFRAAEMGHTDVAKVLIEGGAEVDIVDQEGRSPLHWAALGGNTCICTSLINHEISPNIQDFAGRTPLQCAAYGGFINAMSLLIEKGADTNIQDNQGMTALHMACTSGVLDAVKLLLEHGAFPNHMEYTEDHFTPLDYGLLNEHHEVSQYMIEQGALSITAIRDIAATRIQAYFRGYRVRKTFLDRKMLLMKHEQLRKYAAKKKGGVCKKQGDGDEGEICEMQMVDLDIQNGEQHGCCRDDGSNDEKNSESQCDMDDAEKRLDDNHAEDSMEGHGENGIEREHSQINDIDNHQNGTSGEIAEDTNDEIHMNGNSNNNNNSSNHNFDEMQVVHQLDSFENDAFITQSEDSGGNRTMKDLQRRHIDDRRRVVEKERHRLAVLREKNRAATVIQKNWRIYKINNYGIVRTLVQYQTRLPDNETSWERQLAACRIQLAWRHHYRRKMLKSLGPIRTYLHTWDPDFVRLKQNVMMQEIYNHASLATRYRAQKTKRRLRPNYVQHIPSSAALSFNYAANEYTASPRKFVSAPREGMKSLEERMSPRRPKSSRTRPKSSRHRSKSRSRPLSADQKHEGEKANKGKQSPRKSASQYSYNYYH